MRITKLFSLVAVAGAAALSISNTSAATLVASTSYGGSAYELWDSSGITWSDANSAAIGLGGHLAVLTDAAETTAVYNAFIGNGFFTANDGQRYQAWLGGYTTDPGFTTTNPNAWAWVTGEAWTAFDASNFAGGEPNGDSSGLTINRFGTPKWNDEGTLVGGYIVEFERTPDAGSTVGLMSASVALLGMLKKRRA